MKISIDVCGDIISYSNIKDQIKISECSKELEKLYIEKNRENKYIDINREMSEKNIENSELLRRPIYLKFYEYGSYDGLFLKKGLKKDMCCESKKEFIEKSKKLDKVEEYRYEYLTEKEKIIYGKISNELNKISRELSKKGKISIASHSSFPFLPFIIDRNCEKKVLFPSITLNDKYTDPHNRYEHITYTPTYKKLDDKRKQFVLEKVYDSYSINDISDDYHSMMKFEYSSCLQEIETPELSYYDDILDNILLGLESRKWNYTCSNTYSKVESFLKTLLPDTIIENYSLSSFVQYMKEYSNDYYTNEHIYLSTNSKILIDGLFSDILSLLSDLSDETFIFHTYNTDSEYVGLWWIIGCFDRWVFGFNIMSERDS